MCRRCAHTYRFYLAQRGGVQATISPPPVGQAKQTALQPHTTQHNTQHNALQPVRCVAHTHVFAFLHVWPVCAVHIIYIIYRIDINAGAGALCSRFASGAPVCRAGLWGAAGINQFTGGAHTERTATGVENTRCVSACVCVCVCFGQLLHR